MGDYQNSLDALGQFTPNTHEPSSIGDDENMAAYSLTEVTDEEIDTNRRQRFCAICLETIETGSPAGRVANCDYHIYHRNCLILFNISKR